MPELKIGMCALKQGSGCTSMAIHLANYMMGGTKTVSIVEPKNTRDAKFSIINTPPEENGTFIVNGVRFYPAELDLIPQEDIIIYDFGVINYLTDLSMLDKIFLCTKTDENDYVDLIEYFADNNLDCELLLLNCSKEELVQFRKTGKKCTIIPGEKSKACPYELATTISLFLRSKNIIPPQYHSNWEYDEVIFGKEEEEPAKKTFPFTFPFPKKKKEQVEPEIESEKSGENKNDNIGKEPAIEDNPEDKVQVTENKKTSVISKPFEENRFIKVPTPVPVPAPVPVPVPAPSATVNVTPIVPVTNEELPHSNVTDKATNESEVLKEKEPGSHAPIEKAPVLKTETLKAEVPSNVNTNEPADKQDTKGITEKPVFKQKKTFTLPFFGKSPASKDVNTERKTSFSLPDIKLEIPEKQKKIDFLGHMSIFVTELRHGCGSSYTAGSLASALTEIYNRNAVLCHKEGTNIPDNPMISEAVTEEEVLYAYRKGIVIFDKGVLNELDNESVKEMHRSDIRILVCGSEESDIKKLAQFIHQEDEDAYDWIYVFNHVLTKKRERKIKSLMQDFDILILPIHDYSELPKDLIKDWKRIINDRITAFR